jgi:hypothetical protein
VALGVQPKKQEKMPFKIRLRIEKVQKVRESKRKEELKQSDEVTAKNMILGNNKRKKQEEQNEKKKKFKKY